MTTLYVTYNHIIVQMDNLPKNTNGFTYDGVCQISLESVNKSNTCEVTPSFNIKYGVEEPKRAYRKDANLTWSGMTDQEKELREYLMNLANKIKSEVITTKKYIVNEELDLEFDKELSLTNAEEGNKVIDNNENNYIEKVKEDIQHTLENHKKESNNIRKENAKEKFNSKKEEIDKQKEEESGFW